MNALYITETDVARLVTIHDAIDALDECFAHWRELRSENLPRGRARLPGGAFNLLGAGYSLKKVFGLKAYFAAPGGARFHVMLYSAESGALLAMIEADLFGQLRTGAASGIATRLLARPDASSLAVIGAGQQAFAQVAAIAAVRPIRSVSIFSRSAERRSAFARRIERELNIEAVPADSADSCVGGADIVTTITKSPEPVCLGAWLSPGVHVNAAGANAANRRELDQATILRADARFTDSIAQARLEAGEFIDRVAAGQLAWEDVGEIGDLASGATPGRRSERAITLYQSLGLGIEDVAFAALLQRRAIERGVEGRLNI